MATDIPMNTLEHVVYGGTELNALDTAGCSWRKPYSITIPAKPTGVSDLTVTRSASESNCGQLNTTSITASGTVLYGDTLSLGATAATGYNNPTVSFTSGVSNNKVVGNVAVSVTAGTGKTYYVYYNKGTSTGGTLPSTQSRIYPNGVALGTNNMTKSNTTANSYTVTYAQGNASNTTNLPSKQTSINTTTYTANGWTTGASNYNDPDYANGASFGANSTTNLTLYPNFTTSTTNGGITFASNTMSKNSTTELGSTVTYAKGTATGGTLPAAQTATNTREYTANGWTRSQNGDKNYTSGGTLSTLSENLTLYPYFSSRVAFGGVTIASNNMTKSNTTANSYTVTYAQGNASNTTNLPSKQTSINTTTYTANGWTKTSGSTTRDYRDGYHIQVPNDITIYPCFSQSTTNGGVTVSSNTMSRSNTTENGYTLTYNKGTATSTNVPSSQTATDTRSYTHNGWATSASGSKAYNKGASIETLSSSITLYPYFDSSVTRGSVTLATNSMTKSSTTDATYTITYNYNGNGTSNTTDTATKTRSYTANGWTITSGSTTRTYTNGQSVQLTRNITVYPCFSESVSISSVALPTPTRTGYTFKGWSTLPAATTGITGGYTPNGNVTLYAIWEAKGSSASITFPAIPMTTVRAYTQAAGSSNRIFATTKDAEYSGYGAYTGCTIDGVDVTGSWSTTVKETGALLNSTTYSAKFTGGTLYVTTRAQGVGSSTTTSMKLSANAYSTTATFIRNLSQPEIQEASVDLIESDGYSELEVIVYNPNNVAVTAQIDFYDRNDVHYGSGSLQIPANDTASTLMDINSSSSFENGCYIEAILQAPNCNDSEVYVYGVSVI